jgi:hypothetical protein
MIMDSFEEKYQKVHKRLSFIKSGIRIAACALVLFLPGASVFGLIGILALGFMIAEFIGILEEMI